MTASGLAAVHAAIEDAEEAAETSPAPEPKRKQKMTKQPVMDEDMEAEANRVAKAYARGADDERARILAIEDAALPGHDALIAKLKADGTGENEALRKILAAEKASREKHAAKIAAVENVSGHVPASVIAAFHSVGGTGNKTPEEWRKEWEVKPELQDEFPTPASYAGYQIGLEAGRIGRRSA